MAAPSEMIRYHTCCILHRHMASVINIINNMSFDSKIVLYLSVNYN